MIQRNYNGKHRLILYGIVIAALVIFTGQKGKLHAQINQTIYFMENIPQASLLNPAYQHAHNFHLGLPLLSSFNANAKTNFVNFRDLIFKHPQYDSLISFLHPDADPSQFTSRLRESNLITPDLHINLFSFGFRANKSFLSFSISERASFRAAMPRDFILLGLQGNEQFTGRKADFSGIGADLNYFREYAVGFAYNINERLNIGFRPKLLFGKANLSFANSDIYLYTDPDSYNMRLHSQFTMNFSMPVTLTRDENGDIDEIKSHFDRDDYDPMDFIFNASNTGYAVDLGFTYRIIKPVTLYASIVDLGYINWKNDVYNLFMDGDFEFEGLDLSPAFNHADDSRPGDNLLDSLKGLFSIGDTSEAFRGGLPARVYLGGTFELNKAINLGLLGRSEFYQNRMEQAVTLSANINPGRWLSTSVSYSMMNNSYNNFGMGLSLRGLGFQLYMLTDNLNTVFQPHKSNSLNLWFGLNLIFGRTKSPVVNDPVITEPV